MIRPRVLLADDHRLLLDAFEKLLEPECDIVGAVADGRALLAACRELKPDVVVVDIGMPVLNGLDAGRLIKEEMPEVRLVFLTMNEDPDLAAEAVRSGADGYLLKSSAASELLEAIRVAMLGRSYVTPLVTKGMVDALQRPLASRQLTVRQREVVQLLAEGRSMKEAARVLDVTTRTIAFHKYRIMDILGLKTSADLVQYAVKHGIVATA